MPLDPSRVYDTAADILDCVVAGMEDVYDEYTPAIELPARQYVHAGDVAWDCPQVVVTVPEAGLTHAFPGEAASILVCSPPRHVAFEVWIVRCVPSLKDNGDPPTPEELDAAARTTLTDLWTLAYVLWSKYSDGCWGSTCASVLFGPVEIVGPEGTHTAVKATVFLLIT